MAGVLKIDDETEFVGEGLPTYRGVPGTEFVWRGEWNDPAIDYKGHRINYYEIEDAIWEDFVYYHPGHRLLEDWQVDAGFQRFVETHTYYIYDYLENAIDNGAPKAPRKVTDKEFRQSLLELQRYIDENKEKGVI